MARNTRLITRRLEYSDSDAVLRINRGGRPGVSPLDAPEFERLIGLPGMHLKIIDPEGLLHAYALAFHGSAPYDGQEFLVFVDELAEPFVYIDQVAVHADLRRTGVASSLYQSIEAEARQSGMSALCCEVNMRPANPDSLAFHAALGFAPLKEMETDDGRQVVLLVKRLD